MRLTNDLAKERGRGYTVGHNRPTISMLALLAGLAAYQPAHAALTLTAAGVADGFTLSTYFTSAPGSYYQLLDVTTIAGGGAIATGYDSGTLNLLPDVDGQTPGSITKTAGAPGVPGPAYSVATIASGPAAGTYYAPGFAGGNVGGSNYYKVNTSTLALTPLTLTSPTLNYLGMWADPVTGHLVASSYSGLVDIDPVTGAVHVITSASGFDGVTVSPNGTRVYAEDGGNIYAYLIAGTNDLLATYSSDAGHAPDGTGVISAGALDGDIVVNNNDGTVGLINPASDTTTIIATGGGRGDFVGPDLTNGTLFLSSAGEGIERLGISGGCIGSSCGGGTGVPEPATMAVLGVSLAGLAAIRRRRA